MAANEIRRTSPSAGREVEGASRPLSGLLYPSPNLVCPFCGLVMMPVLMIRPAPTVFVVEHPPVSEYLLDLDIDLNWCPNNGKVWKLDLSNNLLKELYV